jgi:DNA-directed RNA polymerase subunit RPC12/RpoP
VISADAIVCYACGASVRKEGGGAAEETAADTQEAASGEEEMACPNCGTMISKEASVCYACGQEVGAAQKEAKAAEGEESPATFKKPPVFVKKIMKKKIG